MLTTPGAKVVARKFNITDGKEFIRLLALDGVFEAIVNGHAIRAQEVKLQTNLHKLKVEGMGEIVTYHA